MSGTASNNNPFNNSSSNGNLLLDSEDTEYGNGGDFDYNNQSAFQQTLPAPVNRDILNQQQMAAAAAQQQNQGTLKANAVGFIQQSDIERYTYNNNHQQQQPQMNHSHHNQMRQSSQQPRIPITNNNNNFFNGSNAGGVMTNDIQFQQHQSSLKHQHSVNQPASHTQQQFQNNSSTLKNKSQSMQQASPLTTNSNAIPLASTCCPYHQKSYVAYCMMHKELMCEECCDLSHHKDHNNQILLLKAAAQSFLKDLDFRLSEVLSAQKVSLIKCQDFNLRNEIRKQLIGFFDGLRRQIDDMQKVKMDEFNKLIKDTNVINIKQRSKEVAQRADHCEQFLSLKKSQFDAKNYVSFLSEVDELEKQLKASEKLVKEATDLLREQDQQKSIEFIHDREKAETKIKTIIEQTLKVPILKYNRDMLDTLHFFVYNTHNLFMYNFRTHSYRSYVVNIKIPANFMSVENEEGRIFLTGGGEPGKATKFCYEFVEERLVQRRDMLFERRAHTLTSVLVDSKKSQIFAIGSSLPNESMNKCEVYDVQQDQWTQIPSLNTKRNFHTTIAFDCQALYVVAGFNGGQRTNLIEKFDLKRRQSWETLNLKIKENTNWICLEGCGLFQISNQHILIFGGFTTSDQKTNHCYMFNVQSNEIEQLNCKTRTQSNFYQRQPKIGTADGKLYCVETNSLDLHIFDNKTFEWDFIDRKFIGW